MIREGIFEKILREKGLLLYTNQGRSMLPYIKEGKDILVITPASDRISKYDIVLVKRPSGRYLLHRVLKVNAHNQYIICGDNSFRCDVVIDRQDIIGKLDALIRDGRRNELNSIGYLVFVHIWCRLFFLRKPVLTILNYMNYELQ